MIFPGDMDLISVKKFYRDNSFDMTRKKVLRIDFSLVTSVNFLFIGFVVNVYREVCCERAILAKNLKTKHVTLINLCRLGKLIQIV